MDEWLDIYDEHQRPTGRLRRRGDPIEPGDRYLVVTVFVRDSGGRFLTTRRSPQKAYYPGCWEVTSGTAQAKEDGLAAAVRELAEETGLAPGPAAFHYLGRLEHPTDGQGGIFILDHFSCAAAFGRTGHPDAAGGGGGLALAHPGRGGAAVPHHPHGAADPLWLAGIPGDSAPRAAGHFRTEPIRRLLWLILQFFCPA